MNVTVNYRNVELAYQNLGPEDSGRIVRIGLGPLIHRVYRFDWNDRREEGALNFLYYYGH